MKFKCAKNPELDPLRPQRLPDRDMFLGVVVRVADGDTICIERVLGSASGPLIEYVRLAMLDAPELKGPDRAAAIRSRDALARLVLGRTVEIWPARIWRDPYHRIIARVFWQGQCLTAWSIKNGWGIRTKKAVRKR